MGSSEGSRRQHSVGRELRFDKAIGRVGALAVMLGVGVGLGAPLGCGIAYASGPDSTSTSPDRSPGRTSAGNASGGASTSGTGRRPSARGPRDSAATGPVTSARGRTATPDDTLDAPPVTEVGQTDNDGAEPKVSALPDSAATRGAAQPAGAKFGDTPPASPAANDSPTAGTQQQTTRALTRAALPTPNENPATAATAGAGALPVPASSVTPTISPIDAAAEAPALRAAASAAPITLRTIITDTLTWIGLGALAPRLPIPDLPMPAFIESLWLGVRQFQRAVNNQRPTTQPTLSGQDPDGTIRGSLNAADFEGEALTFAVTTPPDEGTLSFDTEGNFSYAPGTQIAATGGTDSFTVTIDDGARHGLLGLGGPTTATVTVTVAKIQPVNQGPTAVNDSGFTIAEDTVLTLSAAQLVGNDTDPNPGDTLSVAGVAGATNGTVALTGDGSVTFTPTADYNGAASFTYTVKDAAGVVGANPATVAITVTAVNDTPTGVNDGPFTVTQDTPLTLSAAQLVGNDTDPDKPYGDTLSVASAGFATGGAVRLNPDGTVTFTPDANYAGPASFTYRVKDTAGATGSTSTKVTLTVVAVNQGPTAVNDSGFTIAEDRVLTLTAAQLVGNDTDPNPGDTLSIAGVAGATNGTVALVGDGSVTFTPTANYNGAASFIYTVKDAAGVVGANPATVAITVTALSDPPTGVDDGPFTVTENTPLTLSAAQLVGNDTDPDSPYGDTLAVAEVIGVSIGGTAELNDDGTVTFTPDTDYTGPASFTYYVKDTAGSTNAPEVATVSLTVVEEAGPTLVYAAGFFGQAVLILQTPKAITDTTPISLTAAKGTIVGDATAFTVRDVGEFGELLPGQYILATYSPADPVVAHQATTTDTLTLTIGGGAPAAFAVTLPIINSAPGITVSPRSNDFSADPTYFPDLTVPEAYVGVPNAGSGELEMEIGGIDSDGDSFTITYTDPAYGTLQVFSPNDYSEPGRTIRTVQFVYTPDPIHRTSPNVYRDSFTVTVNDDLAGGVNTVTVPVNIIKEATLNYTGPVPVDGTISGRVTAPFDNATYGVLKPDGFGLYESSYGSLDIDSAGHFTYTVDPAYAGTLEDGSPTFSLVNDSFAVFAISDTNQWAAVYVPIGGAAPLTLPTTVSVLSSPAAV